MKRWEDIIKEWSLEIPWGQQKTWKGGKVLLAMSSVALTTSEAWDEMRWDEITPVILTLQALFSYQTFSVWWLSYIAKTLFAFGMTDMLKTVYPTKTVFCGVLFMFLEFQESRELSLVQIYIVENGALFFPLALIVKFSLIWHHNW